MDISCPTQDIDFLYRWARRRTRLCVVGALRTAGVGIALSLCALFALPQTARAGTTTTTAPTSVPISFSGTAADGTAITLTAHITDVVLSRLAVGDPTANAGAADMDFLSLATSTDVSAGSGPTFDGINGVAVSDIDVALPDGTLVPAQPPGPQLDFLDGELWFDVPSSTRSVTLEVAPGTLGALEYPGAIGTGEATLTTIVFQPSSVVLAVPPPGGASPAPTTTQPPKGPSTKASGSIRRTVLVAKRKGLPVAAKAGIGAGGGLLVIVLLIPIWRRRAFRRADKQGRVIFDAPPVAAEEPAPPSDDDRKPEDPSEKAGVEVKVLGPVVFEGLVRAITTTPVAEILAFLALHRGRSFTSEQLRNAIWSEGRREPKSDSFYTYVSALRRSLPPGSLVKSGTRYSLTSSVISDWGGFRTLIERSDNRTEGLEEALGLVRGRPFEGAVSGRNSPYAWAADLSHQIEAAVESAGHELAALFLDAGDPVPADAAIGQVLRCVPASIVAREDCLRVGSLLGGPKEVTRRLDSARLAMGDDVELLAPLAEDLDSRGS